MDLTIPIGAHLFTPEALQKALDAATSDPNVQPGTTHVIAGSVDASGAKAALVFGAQDGRWKVEAAYAHTWDGDDQVGAKFIASW
jgi:hypothetical protein